MKACANDYTFHKAKIIVTFEDGYSFDAHLYNDFCYSCRNQNKIWCIHWEEENFSEEENQYIDNRIRFTNEGVRPAKKIETILNQWKREHNKYFEHRRDASITIKSIEVA